MPKYYAVHKGHVNDVIHDNWEECKQNINGVSLAKYKSFPTYEQAKAWLDSFQSKEVTESFNMSIYTDGSHSKGVGGWSFIVVENDVITNSEYGKVPYSKVTNNISELYAIMKALEYCLGKSCIIYTDSNYSINSLTDWKHNSGITNLPNRSLIEQVYKLWIKCNSNGNKVGFSHVEAHKKNLFNNEADRLANLGRMINE